MQIVTEQKRDDWVEDCLERSFGLTDQALIR